MPHSKAAVKRQLLVVAAACVAAAIPSYVAYLVAGWAGVGVLGLLIAFVAVRLDLERDGPIGDYDSRAYTAVLRGPAAVSDSERAALRADGAVDLRGARIALIVGAALIALGGAGLMLF